MELIVDVLLLTLLQIFNQLLEHFTQNLEFYFVDSSKNLNGDGLVNWKHLGDSRRVEAR